MMAGRPIVFLVSLTTVGTAVGRDGHPAFAAANRQLATPVCVYSPDSSTGLPCGVDR